MSCYSREGCLENRQISFADVHVCSVIPTDSCVRFQIKAVVHLNRFSLHGGCTGAMTESSWDRVNGEGRADVKQHLSSLNLTDFVVTLLFEQKQTSLEVAFLWTLAAQAFGFEVISLSNQLHFRKEAASFR